MKICFIGSENESLGIEYLSAVLKSHGFSTDVIIDPRLFDDAVVKNNSLARIFNFEKIILEKLEQSKPDLTGFQVFANNYHWALRLSKKIKNQMNIPILLGGRSPRFKPCPTG
ncbi:MAG: cobalamin-dependent protein [Candidatus Aureabacteria bacterium]|nr:cobalamin-dependent protein [Candidatus Auribacterota bacterium]